MVLIPMGTPAPPAPRTEVADQIPWTFDMTVPVRSFAQPLTFDNVMLATFDCNRLPVDVVPGDGIPIPPGKVNTLYGPGMVDP